MRASKYSVTELTILGESL